MNNNNVTPWYKIWWIWVIIAVAAVAAVAVIVFVGTQGSSDDSINNASSSSDVKTTSGSATKVSSSDNILSKEYKVGETIDYKGYKIMVNDVKYDSGSDYETPKSGNKFVVINVTIENDTNQKQDYNAYDFKLSADGNATDLDADTGNDDYDNDTIEDGTLDTGAKVTGYLIGEANPSAKLKLQYQPDYFDNNTVDIDLN